MKKKKMKKKKCKHEWRYGYNNYYCILCLMDSRELKNDN